MGSLPFAFSVHHFINSVGADAGFASIIGLAILILLYFAQARETSSLREHSQEAAQRIQDLEARVAQLGRAQPQGAAVAAQPQAGRAQAVNAAGAGRGVPEVAPVASRLTPQLPIAPAGVGAPALTAATKLIPTPAPAALAALANPPDATVVGAAGIAAPATVAGAANGSSVDAAPAPAPVSAPAATQTPPPRIQIRPSATMPPTRRPAPPLRSQVPPRQGRFSAGRILVALAGLLVLAGVVVLLLVLTSGSSPKSTASSTATTNAPGHRHSARQPAVTPSSVTVAVLNGTATAGLAHRVAQNLATAGYKEGTIATATDQTHTTTTVAYLGGFRADALAVAKSLKLGQNAVSAIDQATQSVACPPPGSCATNVVVTVGSNLATTQ